MSGFIGPLAAEGLTWHFAGHPGPTFDIGVALAGFCLVNYLLCFWHRRFKLTQTMGVSVGALAILGAIVKSGGVVSPVACCAVFVVLMTGFVGGSRLGSLFGMLFVALFIGHSANFLNLGSGANPEAFFLIAGCVATLAVTWVYERERLSFSRRRDDLFDLVDHVTDPVVMLQSGSVVYHNRAFVALTGKTRIGQSDFMLDLYPAWARKVLQAEAIPEALRTGSWTGELALYNAEGAELPVLQTLTVREQVEGTIVRAGLLFKDISALKQHTEQLQQARQDAVRALESRSRFLANMSHEIRTPLNGILGMVALLRDDTSDVEAREKLSIVESSGEHLMSLINDILDLSKLESGKLVLEARAFDPARVVAEVVALFQPVAAERGNRLAVDIQGDNWVMSDEARFRQVLFNLVSNAIKFTTNGSVTIGLHSERRNASVELKLSVSDTGIGIPSDKLERIFRPFEQVDTSTTRRFGGTGLGLTICGMLAERLGGNIDVTSLLGQGSTFTLRYEAPAPDQVPCPSSIRTLEQASTSLRVLVAEDNVVNRKVIAGFLRKLGVEAEFAFNGLEVLERLEHHSYDLILMDCHMPEMDGLEATRRVIERYGSARPKIVALTASAMPEERARCFDAGMDGFIAKPVRLPELAEVLKVG